MLPTSLRRERRRNRSRYRGRLAARNFPRLSIFRSNLNTYAQIIDDGRRVTLVSVSTLDKVLRDKLKSRSTVTAARAIGMLIAGRAIAAGIKEVIFDRGPYRYHGRVKALAEAAREGGLSF